MSVTPVTSANDFPDFDFPSVPNPTPTTTTQPQKSCSTDSNSDEFPEFLDTPTVNDFSSSGMQTRGAQTTPSTASMGTKVGTTRPMNVPELGFMNQPYLLESPNTPWVFPDGSLLFFPTNSFLQFDKVKQWVRIKETESTGKTNEYFVNTDPRANNLSSKETVFIVHSSRPDKTFPSEKEIFQRINLVEGTCQRSEYPMFAFYNTHGMSVLSSFNTIFLEKAGKITAFTSNMFQNTLDSSGSLNIQSEDHTYAAYTSQEGNYFINGAAAKVLIVPSPTVNQLINYARRDDSLETKIGFLVRIAKTSRGDTPSELQQKLNSAQPALPEAASIEQAPQAQEATWEWVGFKAKFLNMAKNYPQKFSIENAGFDYESKLFKYAVFLGKQRLVFQNSTGGQTTDTFYGSLEFTIQRSKEHNAFIFTEYDGKATETHLIYDNGTNKLLQRTVNRTIGSP